MTDDIRTIEAATGATGRERDAETGTETAGTETTGTEWDGIRELDTLLPRRWLWTLYATIVWGFGCTIAYPAQGLLGSSSRGALAETVAAHGAANVGITQRVASADFVESASDPDLDALARAGGAALFRTNCSQCHGAGAAGGPGYPNLIDDEWLWGGTEDAIYQTLLHGVRWEDDPDTRYSEMPSFGADGILTRPQIEAVAGYVLSLSGRGEVTREGARIFGDNCAACHGEEGMGSSDIGAPNLADAIWLYGDDHDAVVSQVIQPQLGVMPGWGATLSEAELKQVTHYVHSLGGGE